MTEYKNWYVNETTNRFSFQSLSFIIMGEKIRSVWIIRLIELNTLMILKQDKEDTKLNAINRAKKWIDNMLRS